MFVSDFSKPLILQSDFSLLLDVHNPLFDEARARLSAFAELEKSPEHIHTYRMTPLSLWNAASAGLPAESILETLSRYSRFPVPPAVRTYIESTVSKFGKIVLTDGGEGKIEIRIDDGRVRREILSQKPVARLITEEDGKLFVSLLNRGFLKQALIDIGYPAQDKAPLVDGEPLKLSLRTPTAASGKPFRIRDYQADAVKAFYRPNTPGTGYGVVVLPCGSGKTVVGIGVLNELQCAALILTANISAVRQWKEELLDKTTLSADQIGEYSGETKEIREITVATYQILTWRSGAGEEFPHFSVFMKRNWGLIIYDEVHLLPAPVFRITAEIQAMRRLGLTATLIREDGREKDVFSLVGPKRYDVPWKDLEQSGWIASAECVEIRIALPQEDQIAYAVAGKRGKYRIASENRLKLDVMKKLVARHDGEPVIVIGQYLSQLQSAAEVLNAPLINGQTPTALREELYSRFKAGEVKIIVVSKVANFAIDLPDASVAVQISGSFGSRQEEAQRLGRILRPKERKAFFYSLISDGTVEETFAANRQKFLIEQGYKYSLEFDGP